jgi:hypothetical protein
MGLLRVMAHSQRRGKGQKVKFEVCDAVQRALGGLESARAGGTVAVKELGESVKALGQALEARQSMSEVS